MKIQHNRKRTASHTMPQVTRFEGEASITPVMRYLNVGSHLGIPDGVMLHMSVKGQDGFDHDLAVTLTAEEAERLYQFLAAQRTPEGRMEFQHSFGMGVAAFASFVFRWGRSGGGYEGELCLMNRDGQPVAVASTEHPSPECLAPALATGLRRELSAMAEPEVRLALGHFAEVEPWMRRCVEMDLEDLREAGL